MPGMREGQRREDRSFWFWTSYLAEKYKLLIWLLMLTLLAIGFDFKTPAQAMKNLQVQIDTLKKYQDTLRVHDYETVKLLKDVKTLSCLDHKDQIICGGR